MTLAQYTFLTRLKIQGGLRFDIYKTETFALGVPGIEDYHAPVLKKFMSLNGSVGATYNINQKLLLRGNLAKAYRVPNLSELTSNGEHGNRFEIGNNNLKPEDAYEGDASMHFHGEYLSMDMAAFYNHIDNYIYISPTPDTTSSGLQVYRFSQSSSDLFGGEAGVHLHPEILPWLHIQCIYSTVTGKQESGDFLPFIPAHKFRYEVKGEWQKMKFIDHPSLWISALTALKKDHPSPYETETGGYTLINAGVNAYIRLVNQFIIIGLSVNNIFDTQYFDHLSTLKPLNYYNQGRNISLTLNVPFGIK